MDKRLEQMKLKEQALSHEYLTNALDYNPETGVFIWKNPVANNIKPGMLAGTLNKNGYVCIILKRIQYLAHRLAWFYVYKQWPSIEAWQIDHIDGNRANNAIRNLRTTTNMKNAQNHCLYASNTSGATGIYFDTKAIKWRAFIKNNVYDTKRKVNKLLYLGTFDTFEEAVKARKEAEKKYGYIIREV